MRSLVRIALAALLGVGCTAPRDLSPFLVECGDGVVEGVEECDDADDINGNGCSVACRVEPGYTCERTDTSTRSICRGTCGDGIPVRGEGCDDGNDVEDDGCTPSCVVEGGFECVGAPSRCQPICGDGRVVGSETCDDAVLSGPDEVLESNDGCDDGCQVERGYVCNTRLEPSQCDAVCGDGIIVLDPQAFEGCDDGNEVAGDGCAPSDCSVEGGWSCEGEPSVCRTICGDGQVRGEEGCDDGANEPGDGCDPSCRIEPGFNCEGGEFEPSDCTLQWEAVDDARLVPPSGAVGVWSGEELLFFGGGEAGVQALDTAIAFDARFEGWRELAPFFAAPPARVGHDGVWTGNRFFVFGGYDPDVPRADAWAYDPLADAWTELPAAPEGRAEHVVVWTGTAVVAVGGVTEAGPATTALVYQPAEETWTRTASVGSGRRQHVAVWTGERVFVHGGLVSGEGGAEDPVDAPLLYAPSLDRWRPVSPSPLAPRSGHAAVRVGSEILVFGGRDADGEPLGDGARYDPRADTWTLLPAQEGPGPRVGPAMVVGSEQVFVVGGFGASTPGGRYRPATDAWGAITTVQAPADLAEPTAALVDGRLVVSAGGRVGFYRPPEPP